MANKSILIIIAHKGEAKSFLEYFQLEKISFSFPGLFRNEAKGIYLLLTGEGHYQALERTTAVLSFYQDKFSKILNLGICGQISKQTEFKIMDPLRIKNSFFTDHPKSYTLVEGDIDCVTSKTRIENEKQADALSQLAPLVDCELWGIARACTLFNLPLQAIKIVSDSPVQNQDDDPEFSKKIINKAPDFSKALLAEFIKLL